MLVFLVVLTVGFLLPLYYLLRALVVVARAGSPSAPFRPDPTGRYGGPAAMRWLQAMQADGELSAGGLAWRWGYLAVTALVGLGLVAWIWIGYGDQL